MTGRNSVTAAELAGAAVLVRRLVAMAERGDLEASAADLAALERAALVLDSTARATERNDAG